MKNVTIGDLRLYLRDLLDNHVDELRYSVSGQLYEPRLRAKREAIDALPEAGYERSPFAEELATEDAIHDGVGMAVIHLSDAILAHPTVSQELKDTARMVRSTFIDEPITLQRSYADEAATALNNRPKLAKNEAALTAVQVPGSGSLFDWINAFLNSGDALDVLLQKRAKALAVAEDASSTAPLRAATVGLLTRFRDGLRDEMSDPTTKLPRDHESLLFAYLDKLSADRAAKVARRAGNGASEPTREGAASEPPASMSDERAPNLPTIPPN